MPKASFEKYCPVGGMFFCGNPPSSQIISFSNDSSRLISRRNRQQLRWDYFEIQRFSTCHRLSGRAVANDLPVSRRLTARRKITATFLWVSFEAAPSSVTVTRSISYSRSTSAMHRKSECLANDRNEDLLNEERKPSQKRTL